MDEDGTKIDAVWREIDVAANQTLADLGEAIPLAFGFTDPHLWSFFLSGKTWDRSTQYALDRSPGPLGEPGARAARRVVIGDVPFPGVRGTKEFLFLFDYGDEWHFRVKRLRTSDTLEPDAAYHRIAAQHGNAPQQYEGMEEDEEEDDDE
ncbi:MAG: IS1096 element passenger TnpR family protein [Solirubrobacteraceae bacterium]